MLSRGLLPTLVTLGGTAVALGSVNDYISIRQQESALASALRTGDRAALLRLADSQLHVSVQCASGMRSFFTDLSREDWIDTVTHIRTASYNAKVADLRLVPIHNSSGGTLQNLATASIDETIGFLTSYGLSTEEQLSARDTWVKIDDSWRLTRRIYGPVCYNGPHLSFP